MKKVINMPRYSVYKDSGVDWLGDVPEAWHIKRLGSYFIERRTKVSDKDYPPLSVTKMGILSQLENAAKTNDGDNRKLVKKGDFVINSRSDRKGSSGVANLDGSVSLINIVLQPKFINPQFTKYLLKNYSFVEEFYRIGHGIVADLWTTRYEDMKNIFLSIPSQKEQITIVDFLDQKTTQIDQAISIKQKQIELLKERQQIIIQQAVTKGLDPNVPMKDSGIEWIGMIPEHWKISKLKYLLDEINIRTATGSEELLSLSKYQGVIPKSSLAERAGYAESLVGYKIVKKGCLVINKMQAVNGLLAVSNFNGITSPDYSVYKEKNSNIININFLCHLLLCPEFLAEFKKRVTGVMDGFIRLYTDDLYSISIFFPEKEEQSTIVDYIEQKMKKYNNLIDIETQQIEKLKEYKTTLIDSAVTGKIKITPEE